MAKRSYLLRRPRDDDEDDYYTQPEMVKAKPIDAKVARKLDPSYGGGKDFVKASQKSQQEFYGNQEVLGCPSGSSSQGQYREMDHDERNKISASIIKAELKGDTERVRKLKRKLDEGIIEVKEANTDQPGSNERTSVVLMQMDSRSGMPVPAKPRKQPPTAAITSIANKREMKGPMDEDYERQMDLNEMVAAERRMTAEDQIMMFGPTVDARAETQTDGNDDLDDNNILLNQSKKRRHQQEKETRLNDRRRIQEHKFVEQTLDSCPKCIESRLLEKHSIVATGLKTYLAVVNWDGLAPDHCYIAPMGHCPSSVVLDEDVWDEMQLWMKGLVAMWRDDEDQDCVFVENASHLREQRHMIIECIPLPRELGDMAPIYFKKAILESEKEWSDNKKLIELSKNPKRSAGVRGLIPKGFPYFSINFGLQPGYAHVIEDERNFPSNFAQEIIGGMLDLSHQTWKNPKRQSFDEVKQKKAQLREKWMKYDWTEIVKRGINGEGDAQQEEKNEDEDNPET